ncbi:LysR family transcriptional regulator [Sphingobium bisphenolivorans]|uniref:LysR family transcriptional regulator n=1 Tax=Sphingobium bisphenolivorans TaxID=1335760 RepID=UPI00039BCD2D|nr:LysR family transcriptional regulator [Sphingobium bisphenolivorans]
MTTRYGNDLPAPEAREGEAAADLQAKARAKLTGSMDPRKLLYFASVIEHGSFKKAAKQLLISQPALSTSMDRFEASLGEKLLERSPTGVTPTPLGEVLYAHARLIREELERAERRLTAESEGEDNVIAFGTLPSLVSNIVPTAVASWRKTNETAVLRVVEKNQLELLLSLLRGDLDFIVAQTECYGFLEGMRQRVLFRDRLHVIARPGHPALGLRSPNWKQLASFPWVAQMVGRQRMLLEKVLGDEEATLPKQLTECGSVEFIKAMVVGTDSLAVLPASSVSREVQQGKIVPLDMDDPLLNRDIAVLFREGAAFSPAVRELLKHIEAVGISHGDHGLELVPRPLVA